MPNWLTTRINIISQVPRADVGISAKDRIMHHNVIISTSVGYGGFFLTKIVLESCSDKHNKMSIF